MALNNRRSFLKMTALAGAFSSNSLFHQAFARDLHAASDGVSHLDAGAVAQNEDYWSVIQRGFSVSPQIINLNNGGVSPSPIVVQQAVERYNQMTNEGPSYFMWQILDQGREPLRQSLAHLAGASPEEIAINRNSTEALNTIIYGLPFKAGDEVVGCKFDYPNMMNA
jgi:selenocysteine lyase/cysteine desulfurase